MTNKNFSSGKISSTAKMVITLKSFTRCVVSLKGGFKCTYISCITSASSSFDSVNIAN